MPDAAARATDDDDAGVELCSERVECSSDRTLDNDEPPRDTGKLEQGADGFLELLGALALGDHDQASRTDWGGYPDQERVRRHMRRDHFTADGLGDPGGIEERRKRGLAVIDADEHHGPAMTGRRSVLVRATPRLVIHNAPPRTKWTTVHITDSSADVDACTLREHAANLC